MIVTGYSLQYQDVPHLAEILNVEKIPGVRFSKSFRLEYIGKRIEITMRENYKDDWQPAGPEWEWLIESAADIAERNNLATPYNFDRNSNKRGVGLPNILGDAI